MKILHPGGTAKNTKVAIAVFSVTIALVLIGCTSLYAVTQRGRPITVTIPANWNSSYTENYDDYATYNTDASEWFTSSASELSISFDSYDNNTSFEILAEPATKNMTEEDKRIIEMSDNEAWSYISNGLFTQYPSGSFSSNKSKLIELQQSNTETITVDCWYWKYPSDVTNMEKITVQKTFAVNSSIADIFRHVFADIYNDPTKPVINIADKGMGTWVLRGKNHNSSSTMSSHALGGAIDINPSTGSFNVNGTWYGNGYKHKKMPLQIWQSLPETHTKYHVLYDSSPIVEIFKSYGFVWGGDWTSGTDCMHFSFIGDGSTARVTGYNNYLSRN